MNKQKSLYKPAFFGEWQNIDLEQVKLLTNQKPKIVLLHKFSTNEI